MSANEYLIDSSTRHQIMLQRLSVGSFNKLKPLLEKLQKESPTVVGFLLQKNSINYLKPDLLGLL